jgi:cytochrome c2
VIGRLALGVAALLGGAAAVAAQPPSSAGTPGNPAAGAQVFDVRCGFCHGDGGVGGQGPSLIGVVGRQAGTVPNFAYSPAIKSSGITWTAPQLDRFLTSPAVAVPGTAMPMNIPDGKQRADVIAYLGTLH